MTGGQNLGIMIYHPDTTMYMNGAMISSVQGTENVSMDFNSLKLLRLFSFCKTLSELEIG